MYAQGTMFFTFDGMKDPYFKEFLGIDNTSWATADKVDMMLKGTWTPSLTENSSGTITVGSSSGSWIRIGSWVHCTFEINTIKVDTTQTSSTAEVRLVGLPFSIDSNINVASNFATLGIVSTSLDTGSYRTYDTNIVGVSPKQFPSGTTVQTSYLYLIGEDASTGTTRNISVKVLYDALNRQSAGPSNLNRLIGSFSYITNDNLHTTSEVLN